LKRTIKASMKEILFKFLVDFQAEPVKDADTMKHYCDKYVDDFERYLRAYHEFKED